MSRLRSRCGIEVGDQRSLEGESRPESPPSSAGPLLSLEGLQKQLQRSILGLVKTHIVGRSAGEGWFAVLENVDEARQEQVEELVDVHVPLIHVDTVPQLGSQPNFDLEVCESRDESARELASPRELACEM